MQTAEQHLTDVDYPLTDAQIAQYRADGFLHVPGVVAGDALTAMRAAVEAAVAGENDADLIGRKADGPPPAKGVYEQIFIQKVNLWTRHPAVARFALSRRFGNLAARLEGVPMRVWHDQALFKEPGSGKNRTPWHQDAPYWPHATREKQTTIWVALKDATIHNGCMSFVGGTHRLGALPPINLGNPQDIFAYAPHIKPVKPTTIELKAGDCTFHNGLTFHYAGPNKSDGIREAFAVIYMPDGTAFDGQPHVCTDPLKHENRLRGGDPLGGDEFPLVSDAT